MKVLIVKTSSMGDIVHTLPALTDASNAIADIRFDWVVEEGFKDIPKWHSSVDRVIPVSIRRWRKAPLKAWCSGEWAEYRRQLQLEEYEAVIDAQGLIKSAVLVAAQAQGDVHGYDRQSIKEPLASKFYQHSYAISKEQHAVERIRQLFAKALHYEVRQKRGDYGIRAHFESGTGDYLVFNHSTTRADKHYPEVYWRELIALAAKDGWKVKLPWGNEKERARAKRLAEGNDNAEVLDKLSICAVAQVIASSAGCISVDTGLSHITAALNRPNVTLFGPTDPGLVGGYGENQVALEARKQAQVEVEVEPKVFASLSPCTVWGRCSF